MTPFETFCVVIYISNFIIGFFGNILVLIYLYDSLKKMKDFNRSLAYILINLALADICTEIFGIIGIILEYELIKHPSAVIGDVVCKVFTKHTLTWSFTNVSVMTVVLLAWERYMAVTQFRSQTFTETRKTKYILYALVSFWFLGPLAYSPYIPFQKLDAANGCVEVFPNKWSKCLIVLCDFTVFFIFPTCFFVFTYTNIILALKKPGNFMSNRRRNQFSYHKVRRKLTRTIMLIVFGFILCWCAAYTIYTIQVIASLEIDALDKAYAISIIFAYFASTSHPIIYSFRSRRFREKVKQILKDESVKSCLNRLCYKREQIEPAMKPYVIQSAEDSLKSKNQSSSEEDKEDIEKENNEQLRDAATLQLKESSDE